MTAIRETNLQLPGQTAFYRGKVRDVYTLGDLLVMIASDRISAFDHVLPRPIPYKGAVLNQIATYFLDATRDICPNWLVAAPDPNVAIGHRCEPVRVEMVIRGYLAGHAARTYTSGLRTLCGVALPDGMIENDAFPEPIITPTTKADEGHDEDISREEILARGLVSRADYEHHRALDADPAKGPLPAFRDSVLPVVEAGLVDMVDGKHALDEHLAIDPHPGHTPGTIAITLASRGAGAMFCGDILHHAIQVHHPDWNSFACADAETARRSRRRVLERCAGSGERLLPTHFGAPFHCRIESRGAGFLPIFD